MALKKSNLILLFFNKNLYQSESIRILNQVLYCRNSGNLLKKNTDLKKYKTIETFGNNLSLVQTNCIFIRRNNKQI